MGEELGTIDATSHGIATAKSQTGTKTSKLERLKCNLKGARIRTVTRSKLFSRLKMLLRLNIENGANGAYPHPHSSG